MPVPKELLRRLQLELDEAPADLAARLAHAPAVDVAEVLNRLRLADAAAVIVALPLPRAAELFDQLALQRRGRLLAQVEAADVERAAGILEQLSADERTDVAREMGEHARRRLLPKLSTPIRAEVEQLLRYPDHSAGGIMTTEFVRLDPGMTVGQALKHIRAVAGEKETIYACYIVEPDTGRLLGAVSLRDLVMAELDQSVTEVMRHHPITVEVLEDQESVAHKIAKYNLLAVPVLERDGRVVGFVTVDDVIDVMTEEQTEDLLRMAAVEPGALDKPYFENSIFRVVRKRIGWLLLLFVAETFTGTVLRHFEGELTAVVALSFFVPLLIGTGGNAGAQTVTTIVRSIALGEISLRDGWRVLAREAGTGVLIGVLVAVVAFGRSLLWGVTLALAITVALTVLVICTWSTTIGSIIPIAAKRFGVDPAVLSAPLITTLVDATGLIIYFTIAKLILHI